MLNQGMLSQRTKAQKEGWAQEWCGFGCDWGLERSAGGKLEGAGSGEGQTVAWCRKARTSLVFVAPYS